MGLACSCTEDAGARQIYSYELEPSTTGLTAHNSHARWILQRIRGVLWLADAAFVLQ
jgi:hypothetical protein